MVVISRAVLHDRQRQAGIDPPAVDQHRAGAALAVVAALLGAGQVELVAQQVEERGPGLDRQVPNFAVDRQGNRDRLRGPAVRTVFRHGVQNEPPFDFD